MHLVIGQFRHSTSIAPFYIMIFYESHFPPFHYWQCSIFRKNYNASLITPGKKSWIFPEIVLFSYRAVAKKVTRTYHWSWNQRQESFSAWLVLRTLAFHICRIMNTPGTIGYIGRKHSTHNHEKPVLLGNTAVSIWRSDRTKNIILK